jgi:Alpha/beta hydrolase family
MVQPGTRSRIVLAILWLLLGATMIAVAVWLGWTRWSVLLSGHPALLVLTIACAVVGLVAVMWAAGSLLLGGRLDREADAAIPRRRTPAQMRRRARVRIILAIPALMMATLLVGTVIYARPFAATPVALTALIPNEQVRIADRVTWYEMSPIREDEAGNEILPTTGLVFVPGARVDPRAYAHVLRPLVDAGFFVAVVKDPLGFSILDPDHPDFVIGLHPDIAYWAVGGHSLGGTTAAMSADANEQVSGLVLFAAYPASRLERGDLKVVSVFGTDDGLVSPTEIEQSKVNLPAATAYVEVPGAAHSWFGDYGEQPGDNPGYGDRAAAQAAMTEAARALLASLAPPPKK